MKEANHCEVLLQSGVRESASCFHPLSRNPRNLELSDAPNVGSNRGTNDRVKRDIFGLQKTEIAVQVSSVGFDGVRCQASCGLKLQPFSCLRILCNPPISLPAHFTDRKLQGHWSLQRYVWRENQPYST